MRGDGSIFPRGNVLWMKFYRDGVPVSMSCGTSSPEIARAKLRAELRKSDEEFTEPRYKRVTVDELVQHYFDKLEAEGKHDFRKDAAYRYNKHVKPVFGDMKAARFDSEAQTQYRKQRTAAGAAVATINRELQVISAGFQTGADMQPSLVKRMPKFHLIAANNARRVFATPEQIAALKREAVNPENFGHRAHTKITPLHFATIVEIAHMFGWRRGEVLSLTVENIHLPDNTIRIEDSKNGDAREVTMTPGIRALVEALVIGKPKSTRLFPFTTQNLFLVWQRVVKAAGCPHLHMHDLRRTSARSKRAAGVDTSVTMAIMGWKSAGMFRRYGIVDTGDTTVAMEKQQLYEDALQKRVATSN